MIMNNMFMIMYWIICMDYLLKTFCFIIFHSHSQMVDEMIKDSPVQSPTTTIPSSPLEFDRNNNNVMWDNDVNHPLATFPLPLTQSLTSCKYRVSCKDSFPTMWRHTKSWKLNITYLWMWLNGYIHNINDVIEPVHAYISYGYTFVS